MQPLQRTALRSARRFRPHTQQQSRRWESHGSQHPSHANKNESFGAGFYITLAVIPASFALYTFTRQGTDQQPYFTRLITDVYADYEGKWARRNDTHTRAMEQAAGDRLLFLNGAEQQPRTVNLRFPEQFNQGAPCNIPAGQGSANIDKVIAKYRQEANEANERKLQQVRENQVPVEQPFEPLVKIVPATPSA